MWWTGSVPGSVLWCAVCLGSPGTRQEGEPSFLFLGVWTWPEPWGTCAAPSRPGSAALQNHSDGGQVCGRWAGPPSTWSRGSGPDFYSQEFRTSFLKEVLIQSSRFWCVQSGASGPIRCRINKTSADVSRSPPVLPLTRVRSGKHVTKQRSAGAEGRRLFLDPLSRVRTRVLPAAEAVSQKRCREITVCEFLQTSPPGFLSGRRRSDWPAPSQGAVPAPWWGTGRIGSVLSQSRPGFSLSAEWQEVRNHQRDTEEGDAAQNTEFCWFWFYLLEVLVLVLAAGWSLLSALCFLDMWSFFVVFSSAGSVDVLSSPAGSGSGSWVWMMPLVLDQGIGRYICWFWVVWTEPGMVLKPSAPSGDVSLFRPE